MYTYFSFTVLYNKYNRNLAVCLTQLGTVFYLSLNIEHKSELIKYTDTKLIGDFDIINCGQFSAAFPLYLIALHDQTTP